MPELMREYPAYFLYISFVYIFCDLGRNGIVVACIVFFYMMKKQFIFSIEVVSIYCKSYIYGMYGLCVQGEVVGFSGTGYDVRSVIGHCISMGLCLWEHDSSERRRSVQEVGWAVSGYMVEKIMAEGAVHLHKQHLRPENMAYVTVFNGLTEDRRRQDALI